MVEKFNWRKFHDTGLDHTPAREKEQMLKNIKERDKIFAERKTQLVGVVKDLILSENIQNPLDQLTIKLLQKLMDANPDKFLGIRSARSLIQTYFFGEMRNLKFSLGLIKE